MQFFETTFLEEVDTFMKTLGIKSRKKVMFNIRIAEQTNDSELFKKLNSNIWDREAAPEVIQNKVFRKTNKTVSILG